MRSPVVLRDRQVSRPGSPARYRLQRLLVHGLAAPRSRKVENASFMGAARDARVCVIWRRCSVLLKHARRNSARGSVGLLSGQRAGSPPGSTCCERRPASTSSSASSCSADHRRGTGAASSTRTVIALELGRSRPRSVRVALDSSTGSSRAFARTAEATSGPPTRERSRGRRAPRGAAGSAPRRPRCA